MLSDRIAEIRAELERQRRLSDDELALEIWASGGDTGNSSLTIYSFFQGPPRRAFTPSIPWDPDDFGRCYRLLKLAPHWRANLEAIAHVWPEWRPLVENWDEMERLYLEELPTGNCRKLYDLMVKLTNRRGNAGGNADA